MWVWGQRLLRVCSEGRFVSEAPSFSVPCCCQCHHSLECDGLVLFLTTCRCHEGFVCSFAVKVVWDSRDCFPLLGMKGKCSHYQTCSTSSLNRGCVCWEVERQWVCIRQVNLQYEFSVWDPCSLHDAVLWARTVMYYMAVQLIAQGSASADASRHQHEININNTGASLHTMLQFQTLLLMLLCSWRNSCKIIFQRSLEQRVKGTRRVSWNNYKQRGTVIWDSIKQDKPHLILRAG